MRRRTTLLVIIFVLVLVLGGALYIRSQRQENAIKATVTRVISRINVAENGYYGFVVQDNGGRNYEINATGRMNVAGTGSTACIDVPELAVGDTITFALPLEKSPNKNGSQRFTTCPEKGFFSHYFINKH